MIGKSTQTSLTRIETALARIEQASARLKSRNDALDARHARLREAVGEAMRDLDRVIARNELTGAAAEPAE